MDGDWLKGNVFQTNNLGVNRGDGREKDKVIE